MRARAWAIACVAACSAYACRGVLGIEDLQTSFSSDGGATDGNTPGSDGSDDGATGADGSADGGGSDASSDALLGGDVDRRYAQWPATAPSPPPSNYDVTADTVNDKTTLLMWERALPSATGSSLSQAQAHCAGLRAGTFADWRLPTRVELLSLLDYGEASTKLDATMFADRPVAPALTIFWTASDTPTSDAWTVDVKASDVGTQQKSSGTLLVKCVRAGATPPAGPRYNVSSGTATDPRTGLVWQTALRSGLGTVSDGDSYCAGLSLGAFPTGWRLPTIRELATLFDEARPSAPYWDPAFADVAGQRRLWSSTTRATPADANYVLDFGFGRILEIDQGSLNAIRCVH